MLEPAICPPKLTPKRSVIPSSPIVVPQSQFVPSSSSYFTTTSSSHSRDVAAKMAAAYAAKGKGIASPETLKLSSHPIRMAKHIRFTYSDDEKNEVEEDPEEDIKKDPIEKIEAIGSPYHSNASSQSNEF